MQMEQFLAPSQKMLYCLKKRVRKSVMRILPPKKFHKFNIIYINIFQYSIITKQGRLKKRLSKFIGNEETYMAQYHVDFLKKIAPLVKDKTVLEIGGSNFPRKALFDILKVKKWVCVDYWDDRFPTNPSKTNDFIILSLDEAESNLDACDYLKFRGDATYIPECFYEKFDIVVSLNAFEHVTRVPEVVEKIYYCLRRSGIFYTFFAPIWSAAHGHHYWGGENFSFLTIEQDGLPPFIHLLKNEKEMREYFADKSLPFGQAQVDCLCEWSYHSNLINRLFFEDYEDIMANSQFQKYEIIPHDGIKPTDEILEELIQKYPGYKRFGVGGAEILAKK